MIKGDIIDFKTVNACALNIATLMRANYHQLISILTKYETYKTAKDEIERSLDLLENLSENQSFFKEVVGPIATFMPSNQPLYSFTCFAIVPALMSEKVCVKAPEIMNGFYEDMLNILQINEQPFSVEYMKLPRSKCVELFAETNINVETKVEKPTFEAVIFTGTSKNADILRKRFHKSVLFISNGSGHNPIVITETADIEKAVDAIMSVRTYNQGQDCASPNTILVHSQVYTAVIRKLRKEVMNLNVGEYNLPTTDIGPISRPDTLVVVEEFLTKNQKYIDSSTEGVIRIKSNIVEPTIVTKPLSEGANFEEVFAPVFIIQKYETDNELCIYFEDKLYANNAMYITVFGHSEYVESFVKLDKIGSLLHDSSTVIYNTDLHKPGVERGILPYGGYGRGASCVSKDGNVLSMPILAQREIFEFLVEGKPLKTQSGNSISKFPEKLDKIIVEPKITYKDIKLDDLLKLYTPEILKWLCTKRAPGELFELYNVKEIFRFYDEFDEVLETLRNGSISSINKTLLNLYGISTSNLKAPISFRRLLGLGQSVHWDKEKLKRLLKYQGLEYSTESINTRLPRVKYWLENYNKGEIISLREEQNNQYLQNMSKEELQQIDNLYVFISSSINKKVSLKNIESTLYNLVKTKEYSKNELTKIQRNFFKNVYNLLIGADTGPRLSTFIWAAERKKLLKLLDTRSIL